MRYSLKGWTRVLFGPVEVRKIRARMPSLTAFVARMGALLIASIAMLATAAALLGTQPAQAACALPAHGGR